MAKKRVKLSDSGEIEKRTLFEKTEPDPKREKERQRERQRDLKRGAYDMTPELKNAVAKRATRLGIPASQFAMYLLSDGLRRFDNGDIDPTPYLSESDSPRFRNNLDFDSWYYPGED